METLQNKAIQNYLHGFGRLWLRAVMTACIVSLVDAMDAETKEERDMDSADRIIIAEKIAAAIAANDMGAKVWTSDDCRLVRVYVTRDLSRRAQDMGYVEICDDGGRNYNPVTRRKAGIRDMVEGALA